MEVDKDEKLETAEISDELDADAPISSSPNGDNNAQSFSLQIQNLPKFAGMKQIKNFLKKLDVLPSSGKIKIGKGHAFIAFDSDAERASAIKLLNGQEWKGRVLRSRIAQTADTKRRPNGQSSKQEVSPPSETNMLEAVAPLGQMPYTDQLQLKRQCAAELLDEMVKQLRSVSKSRVSSPTLEQIVSSPVHSHYRNKCEFTIGKGADGAPTVGFMAPGSFVVFPTDNCTHIPETMKICVAAVQELVKASDLPCFDEESRTGFWKMLTLRCFSFDLLMILTVHGDSTAPDTPQITTVKRDLVQTFNDCTISKGFRVTSIYFQKIINQSDAAAYEHLAGAPYVYETLLGLRFRVSPGAFFQTNTAAAQVLYGVIGSLAKDGDETVLLDICCGTGTIGLGLAARFKAVIGVELCRQAVDDARQNALLNSITNCRFVCGKAEDAFSELKYHLPNEIKSLDDVNLLGIVDPPRAGLHPKLVAALRRTAALKRLVFVSCDPRAATKNFIDLCRPISNRLAGTPFRMSRVVPVDMFPQTRHCEWVILFER